jgi:hypothetical protein
MRHSTLVVPNEISFAPPAEFAVLVGGAWVLHSEPPRHKGLCKEFHMQVKLLIYNSYWASGGAEAPAEP